MSNTTLNGWRPPADLLTWHRPVLVEDATGGLTACSLPGGGAVVMWPLGDQVRFAVVPSMVTLNADDVIEAGDIHTALTAGETIHRCTVFTTGGQVYFTVLGSTDITDRYWVRIYIADDPSDPTAGWSMHGEVQEGQDYSIHLTGGIDFGGTDNAGQPLVLGSRWVLAAADAYADPSFGGFTGRDASIWTSDDAGATWTKRDTWGFGAPAHWAHHSPPQIVQSPTTGDLIASRVIDVNFTTTIISANDGNTWTDAGFTGPDDQKWQPFLDNGTDVFAVHGFNPDGEIYRLDGTEWVLVAEVWPTALGSMGDAGTEGETTKFIADRGRLWYFVGEYVGSKPMWFVGFVGHRS